MGAAWKVDAILTVITEATFKDRECCERLGTPSPGR